MHSIVVLGDVRAHRVVPVGPSGKPLLDPGLSTIFGGAVMMRDVLRGALFDSDEPPNPNHPRRTGNRLQFQYPHVFGYAHLREDAEIGSELWEWSFRGMPAAAPPELQRLRLDFQAKMALRDGCLPQFDPHLLWALTNSNNRSNLLNQELTEVEAALAKADRDYVPIRERSGRFQWHQRGTFETGAHQDDAEHDRCPDVVVIDDLDLGYRSSFGIDPDAKGGVTGFAGLRERRHRASVQVSHELAARLKVEALRASKPSAAQAPRMEPMLVWSVAGRLPVLDKWTDPVLRMAFTLPALRDRTIVLLSADDLRERNSFSISAGYSWERTAQDTLGQDEPRPALRSDS